MRLEDLRHLSGPNVFTVKPVSVARIELDELTCRQTTDYPGFAGRLTAALDRLWDLRLPPDRLNGLAGEIGSDVAFFASFSCAACNHRLRPRPRCAGHMRSSRLSSWAPFAASV